MRSLGCHSAGAGGAGGAQERERERERELGRGSGADGTGAQNVARRARFLEVFRNLLFVKNLDFQNTTWNLGSDFYDPLASFEATAACKKTSAPWNLRSITNKYNIWRGQNLAFQRFQQNLGWTFYGTLCRLEAPEPNRDAVFGGQRQTHEN